MGFDAGLSIVGIGIGLVAWLFPAERMSPAVRWVLLSFGVVLTAVGAWGVLSGKTEALKPPVSITQTGPYNSPNVVTGDNSPVTINPEINPAPVEQKVPPDVTLRFVHLKGPGLQLKNQSDVVARDIKYSVVLWNLDLPDRLDPLPIPVSSFDWIKPYAVGGPQNVFFTPLVTPLLHPGDRLFGSAAVSCPECGRGHTYVVSIVWGQGGWFAEMPEEKEGVALIPSRPTKETIGNYVKELLSRAPEHSRITIEE